MEIKTLEGQVYNVEVDELYIKPSYAGDKISNWSICTNQRNQEIVLISYANKEVAKHMIDILILCSKNDFETSLIEEVQLCQDVFFLAQERLNKAKIAYMNQYNGR